MDKNRCYLCEKLCYISSPCYEKCQYRRCKSFGVMENRMYEEACTRLAVRFARKHSLRFEGWVGQFSPEKNSWYEGAGGFALFSDEVYSMEEIRADIMMDAPTEAIDTYREECIKELVASQEEGRPENKVNYRNWLLGARHNDSLSTEEWKKLKQNILDESIVRMQKAQQEMEDELQRMADELQDGSEGLF